MSYAANLDKYISILTKYRTVNRNHPLIRYFLPEIYKEEKSSLANFIENLIFFVTDKSNISAIKEGEKDKWQKRLGCSYLEVNWEEYDDMYSDNYRIWTPEYHDFIITKDMLIEWSQYKHAEIVET